MHKFDKEQMVSDGANLQENVVALIRKKCLGIIFVSASGEGRSSRPAQYLSGMKDDET